MKGGKLTYYKAVVELLGLRQLDVYRQVKGGSVTDVLRLLDPATRKVYMVDLGAPRESLSLEEFAKRVRASLEKQGFRVSERVWSGLIYRLQKLGASPQQAAQK